MRPVGPPSPNFIREITIIGLITLIIAALVITKPWAAEGDTPPEATPASSNAGIAAATQELTTTLSAATNQPIAVLAIDEATVKPSSTASLSATEASTTKPVSMPAIAETAIPRIESTVRITPSATPTAVSTPVATTTTTSKRKLVAVDAGHGGEYIGAANSGLAEKQVNLRVAQLLADLLREAGYNLVPTRTSDNKVNTAEKDTNGDGQVTVEDDLQARVDIVNNARADLLVSIHHNGSNTPMRGTMSIYCGDRPQGVRSKAFATMLQTSLLSHFREMGYSPPDMGARDDSTLGKPGGHLVALGPKTALVARPSTMPGALGEALFVSDATEASLLRDDRILQAEAATYRDAVTQYFQAYP